MTTTMTTTTKTMGELIRDARAELDRIAAARRAVPPLPLPAGCCPVCRGHGEVDANRAASWQTFTCGACGGSGSAAKGGAR